jgi:hypothetical protein
VSDVERIATGLSQKIWQKIIIIDSLIRGAHPLRPPGPNVPAMAAADRSGAELAP